MNKKLKIIVFTYSIPMPDKSSGERRFVGVLETLAKKHDVELYIARYGKWLLNKNFQSYIPPLEKKNIIVLPIKKNNIKEILKKKKYDIGIFEFYWIAEETMHIFMRYQPHAVTIVDSVDVHFAREETQAKLGLIKTKKARNTKRRELMIYKIADIAIVVSNEDYELLVDKEKVGIVHMGPNVVPTVERLHKNREPIVIFIGSYAWPPNADAIIWFVEEIWPIVYKHNNNSKLLIIGSDPTEEIKSLTSENGIEVLGFVPETKPYLDSAAISIAPMRYGGGMKGKVNEALAHGVPVITTTIGAQGFNADNGKEMIIEDEPEKFAQSIIDVFNDNEKQVKLGLAGQKLNERLCSPAVVEDYLNIMMDDARKIYVTKSGKVNNSVILKLRLNYIWNDFLKFQTKIIKKLQEFYLS